MAKAESGSVYLKAKTVPEERQNQTPYQTWVQLDSDGSVRAGACDCVAGDGSCKHVAALLFGILDFFQKLILTSPVPVTDEAAKWCQPRRSTLPRTAVELDLRVNLKGEQKPTPSSELYQPTTLDYDFMEKSLFNIIKDQNLMAVAAYGILDDSDSSEYDFEQYPLNIIDFAAAYSTKSPVSFEEFLT